MRTNLSKFTLLFASAMLCLITCKSPVNNKVQEKPDNSWIEEFTIVQLQEGYKEGKYTITDVVKVYLDRNPCGSSSGSGVAVSANLCMLAIGTETNGSIVCPSNNNGIVGIKPTVGLISRSGIIPISFFHDTPGPMGRTVEDVAITLGTLTGIDSSDSKTLASEAKYQTDYSKFLKKEGLNGKRIGLLKKAMGFSDKVDTLLNMTVAFLKANGAEVVEIEFPKGENYEDASFEVIIL